MASGDLNLLFAFIIINYVDAYVYGVCCLCLCTGNVTFSNNVMHARTYSVARARTHSNMLNLWANFLYTFANPVATQLTAVMPDTMYEPSNSFLHLRTYRRCTWGFLSVFVCVFSCFFFLFFTSYMISSNYYGLARLHCIWCLSAHIANLLVPENMLTAPCHPSLHLLDSENVFNNNYCEMHTAWRALESIAVCFSHAELSYASLHC